MQKSETSNRVSRRLLAATVISIVLLATAVYVYAVVMRRPVVILNAAKVKKIGVEVWWDAEKINQTVMINWGVLEPGGNRTVLLYIENIGNAPATIVMDASNWNPSNMSAWGAMSWDYNGALIPAKSMIPVNLTLSISTEVSGVEDFTFDITISAEG